MVFSFSGETRSQTLSPTLFNCSPTAFREKQSAWHIKYSVIIGRMEASAQLALRAGVGVGSEAHLLPTSPVWGDLNPQQVQLAASICFSSLNFPFCKIGHRELEGGWEGWLGGTLAVQGPSCGPLSWGQGQVVSTGALE